MNLKVYQSYYLNEHLEHLDASFIPYDNSKNQYSALYEIPIHIELYQKHKDNKEDLYWGLVSWKWRHKIAKEGKFFLDWIQNNPGYDMYFVDPHIVEASMYNNSITQGNTAHPGLLNYMNKLTKKLGLEIDFNNFVFHPDLFSTCTYWVGNKQFWSKWIKFYDKCLVLTEQDEELMRFASQTIVHNNKLTNHVPFIHERLISIFMLINKKMKFKHYPYDDADLYCNLLRKNYANMTNHGDLYFYKALYFLNKREKNFSTL